MDQRSRCDKMTVAHSITSLAQSRRSRLLERLGYFASSTLVIVAGPSPAISRTASSSLAPSQCTCFPKWVTKVPAGMATVLLRSNLLPVPTPPCALEHGDEAIIGIEMRAPAV